MAAVNHGIGAHTTTFKVGSDSQDDPACYTDDIDHERTNCSMQCTFTVFLMTFHCYVGNLYSPTSSVENNNKTQDNKYFF